MDREIPHSERRRAYRRRWLKIGAGSLAVVGAAFGLASAMRSSVSAADLAIASADTGTIEVTVSGTGSVTPAFEEIITSPINSRIVEVYCHAGDSVKAGAPLLRLDLQTTENEVSRLNDQISMKLHELEREQAGSSTRLSDIEMQIKVKEMTLSRLEVELTNEIYLDSIGSGTGDRVRQAGLAVATARLELEQLRAQLAGERRIADAAANVKRLDIDITSRSLGEMSRTLADARVCSPRDAVVTFIQTQIGEKVTEGQKIAVISDLGHFRVDGEIADAYAPKVGVGSRATVRIGRERLSGVVTNLTPQSQNGVIKFTVTLADDAHPRLRSGLKTDIFIACDVIDETVRIPTGSYYTGPGTYSLFLVSPDGKSLEKRDVKLGSANYEYVEVREGLRPSDRVVLSDMSDFKDATKLRLK